MRKLKKFPFQVLTCAKIDSINQATLEHAKLHYLLQVAGSYKRESFNNTSKNVSDF